MSYPRYVPHSTGDGKWTDADINAVVTHVQAGETVSGYLAYQPNYTVRLTGGKYQAINAIGTLTYGSTTDEGGADGDSLAAVLNACLADGGLTYMKNSCTTLDGAIDLPSNSGLLAEVGTELTYTGAAGTTVFSNSTLRSMNCVVGGFKLDIDSIANVSPFVIDSVWRYRFLNLHILNCQEKPAFTINSNGAVSGLAGNNNTAFLLFDNIMVQDAYGAFKWEGKESNSEITLCKVQNLWAYDIHTKGITFNGWASGIHHDTVWIALDTAGAYGVIWNDSATPTANVGDYDNNFVNLKVDPFGDADHADTTLLQFNCTKGDWIRNFFYSNSAGFLGTAVADIDETVSYRVDFTEAGQDERATRQGLYMRVISKGFNFGPLGADAIALDGRSDGSGAYISLNDSYWNEDTKIYFRTQVAGVNAQAGVSFSHDEGVFRFATPTIAGIGGGVFIFELPDQAVQSKFRVDDNTETPLFIVDGAGIIGWGNKVSGVNQETTMGL